MLKGGTSYLYDPVVLLLENSPDVNAITNIHLTDGGDLTDEFVISIIRCFQPLPVFLGVTFGSKKRAAVQLLKDWQMESFMEVF